MKNKRHSEKLIIAAEQNTLEKEYWTTRLAGITEKSHFPYDHKVKEKNEQPAGITFKFSDEICNRLITISGGSDYALNAILAAAAAVLLYKYTGRGDVVFAYPVYLQEDQAEFINTVLALRVQFEEKMSFRRLLMEIKDTIHKAVEYRNYPIEILADQVAADPDDEYFPLFDAAVLLKNIQSRSYLDHIHINSIFCFQREENIIHGELQYNSSLFRPITIERIVANLKTFLQNALFDADLPVDRIEIISEEEKKQLLSGGDEKGFPTNITVHELFQAWVDRQPHGMALLCGDQQSTYSELNRRAGRAASLLRNLGVTRNTITALMVERTTETITGIIGILRAGGAYMAIDPLFPDKRVRYMLEDSAARVVVTQRPVARHTSVE